MYPFDSFSLGLSLTVIGLLFFGVVWLLLRIVAHARPRFQPILPVAGDLLPDHQDAVLLVETGGRVKAMNPRARTIFQIQEGDLPRLERLARRVRPGEMLLKLCAAEGQARFVLDGRLMEGTSYRVQTGAGAPMLVSLRYPELTSAAGERSGGLSTHTLQIFTQLTQDMAASLDLQETLQAVMSNVEKLVNSDYLEITLWNEEDQSFQPYRFSGQPGLDRTVERLPQRYLIHNSLSGKLYEDRAPLLISDVSARADLQARMRQMPMLLRSYLGFPLFVGNEFIGTLELGSPNADTYQASDLDLVRLFSGQAAIALHNALMYREERQRATELSGLAKLSQALHSVRDPSKFFSSLVESITPLVQVEIIGFLIYNENERVLEARIPFHGIPDEIVELYRAPVTLGSRLEQLLIDHQRIISENASEDPIWEQVGFGHIVQAATLRETVFIPLITGEHTLGYLQASNHSDGPAPFDESELHLLTIAASQAASIIENASLLQQSRQRAQRAEALRRIASLASSTATLDETLKYSLQELAHLLRADMGALFLINQDYGRLEMHLPSAMISSSQGLDHAFGMPIEDPQFPFTVSGGQRVFISANLSQETNPVIPFYKALVEEWKLESLIAVPMVARNEGIGELWFGSCSANFFDQGDVQAVSTAAGQLAGVVEQTYLSGQTDESLRRRIDQMTAITRIGRELSTTLDLNYLLKLVYDEALRTTGADCGTILLLDIDSGSQGTSRAVRFSVGDVPSSPFSSLEELAFERNAAQVMDDFSHSALLPPHEGVQSMLVAPIAYQQRPAGLISLHSRQPNGFDQTAMEITQSLAIQAAVALNNAVAYEEQTRRGALLKREVDTLSHLMDVTRAIRPSQSLQESLLPIAKGIQAATPFQVVLISVYEPAANVLRRTIGVGLSEEDWAQAKAHLQPWGGIQQLLKPEFKVGQAYYIPASNQPAIPEEVHIQRVLPTMEKTQQNAWQADDLLLFPLISSTGELLGMVSVDAPNDQRQPDQPTFDALELFAAQVGLVIENTQRTHSLEEEVSELKAEQVRIELSAHEAQQYLPVLLHQQLDQAVTLSGLNQRMDRVRASLEIAAQANRQDTREGVLHTLASELLTRFAMRVALLAERNTDGSIHLLEVIGSFPSGANPEALFGQRNPLRQMLQSKKSIEEDVLLISNLEVDAAWKNNTLLNVLEARSLLAFPVALDGDEAVGVLVIGQRTLPTFLEEDRRVFAQLSYQVSVGLQNLMLLTETRRRLQEVNLLLDFSRKLGSLQSADIFTALVQSIAQALPNVNAGWVGMWDEKRLTLIPQAAVGYASYPDILGITYPLQSTSGEVTDTRVVLPLLAFRTGKSERVVEIHFASQYHLNAEDLLRYRRATSGRLPISGMVIPLRIGDNVLGVVCLENFETQNAFSEEDEALAYSFTRQAAMALENARLYQASEQRAAQMQALTMVSGAITSSLQRDALISMLLDQLKIVVPYNTATLWLREGDALSVAMATGFADNDLRLGLSVAVEDSALFKTMIQTSEPISVGDVRNDSRFPMLIDPEHLSWLAIPLIYKSEVIGVIALEKHEADFYTTGEIQAATTIASQAAVSLENARLFEESNRRAAELDERSQRLALLNRLSGELVVSLDVDYIFRLTGQQLINALQTDGILAVLIDPSGQYTLQAEVPVTDETLPIELPSSPIFNRLRESRGIFLTDHALYERDLAPMVSFLEKRDAKSLLIVPLAASSALQGWFMVYSHQEYRYNSAEIELARTICNQAAIAIQNARLFFETRRLTEDLERRVEERTHELRREHQNSQTMLHIITELSASLDMGLVLTRTLTVLNTSLGAEESAILLSQGAVDLYRAGIQLIRPNGNRKDGSAERQIARWVVRNRKPVVIACVQTDPRWQIHEDLLPQYQSALAMPVIMGEEVLGTLILFQRQPNFFSEDQLGLMEATARQIGIALNNAELFNLIRDQSENMGNLLREQQIEASRSRAILEAVADGVLVTDPRSRINLFNLSAERILDLKSAEAMGKSLDSFAGVFGKAAAEWVKKIADWSVSPKQIGSGESYAERIDLENGRVVAVHLAPVVWRQEFLGTVSIFRDITHEVQVDRMKSEFVANVSHELRTPMTSIKGYVEIMLMGATGSLNPQQDHFLRIVKSNTERLVVLVNDLLDVSRIEAGRLTLDSHPINMRAMAEEIIADVQRRSREENRPMEFHLEAAEDIPFALGDAERIRQVMSSLVINSYNYTPENGLVTIRITEAEGYLQVDVKDNGIGILPSEQRRIFERFYRGEDPLVLATSGFGLGLAIARTLVEMHHGRIWFSSMGKRGEGSIFSFTLPRSTDKE